MEINQINLITKTAKHYKLNENGQQRGKNVELVGLNKIHKYMLQALSSMLVCRIGCFGAGVTFGMRNLGRSGTAPGV
jgi:hypothetical protein